MDNLKPHKLAKLFPEIPEDEFAQMVADIKAGGLLEPIWTYQGQILDGWHRYQAARKAGVVPRTREWRGKDPIAFVRSENLRRRHLNESQRALMEVELAEASGQLMPQGADAVSVRQAEASGLKTEEELARDANVSPRTIRRARRIRQKEHLKEKVRSGDLSLDEADRRMRPKPRPSPGADWKESGEVKELLEFVRAWRESLPDAIRMVKVGKLSPEAKRFLAARIRPMADMLAKFADWLEA